MPIVLVATIGMASSVAFCRLGAALALWPELDYPADDSKRRASAFRLAVAKADTAALALT